MFKEAQMCYDEALNRAKQRVKLLRMPLKLGEVPVNSVNLRTSENDPYLIEMRVESAKLLLKARMNTIREQDKQEFLNEYKKYTLTHLTLSKLES
jgi:hypothetical protein